MKIRTFAEDFIVTEYLDYKTKVDGKYALFQFEKKGWGTFDVISSLNTRLKIPKNELDIAGIKDRHALTISYLSVKRETAQKILNYINKNENPIPNVTFKFVGYIENPIKSENIKKNKFSIIIRSITDKEIPEIIKRFEIVRVQGVPNYYDDQRFGSARHGLGFVAKNIIQNDLQNAAKLLFSTSKYDKKAVKEAKIKVINFLFNNLIIADYNQVIRNLPSELQNFFKSIFKDKENYLYAFHSMDRRFLILLFHAYQSHLFNCMLSNFILSFNQNLPYYIIKGETNSYLFPFKFSEELLNVLHEVDLPIPSPYIYKDFIKAFSNFNNFSSSDKERLLKNILYEIENKENIKFEDISGEKVKINLKRKFRKGLLVPENLNIYNFEKDEFFKGKNKVKLEFNLEKGSYATMIIKGIFLQGKYGKAIKN